MDAPTLIGDIKTQGMWPGLLNYFGNNTNMGQDWNQLIGKSNSNQQSNQTPSFTDEHLDKPDANGIRPFTSAGKDHINNYVKNQAGYEQSPLAQIQPFIPSMIPSSNPQSSQLQPMQTGSISHGIKTLEVLGIL